MISIGQYYRILDLSWKLRDLAARLPHRQVKGPRGVATSQGFRPSIGLIRRTVQSSTPLQVRNPATVGNRSSSPSSSGPPHRVTS